jgi:hypothetical protein
MAPAPPGAISFAEYRGAWGATCLHALAAKVTKRSPV